jgi:hypothetical protein
MACPVCGLEIPDVLVEDGGEAFYQFLTVVRRLSQ